VEKSLFWFRFNFFLRKQTLVFWKKPFYFGEGEEGEGDNRNTIA
jgi:hypothetical protein